MTKLERLLITNTPLAFILKKSKNWHIKSFEGVSVYNILKLFRIHLKNVNFTERANAVAFNLIMAIPPSLLFLFTLLPNLPFLKKGELQKQVLLLIKEVVPNPSYNKDVIGFINKTFFSKPAFSLLSFGLILALFFASNAMIGIMRSFNKNLDGFSKRNAVQARIVALRLTIYLFGLVTAVLLLLISQSWLFKTLGIKRGIIISIVYYLRWLFIVALIFYSIAFIYKFAPAVKKRWRLVSPGSVVATILSVLASIGFSYFVNNFGRYNVLYGSIGTILVVMALIQLNALVLLIGFELNVSIYAATHKTNSKSQIITT
jgi:membrane protein